MLENFCVTYLEKTFIDIDYFSQLIDSDGESFIYLLVVVIAVGG